MVPFGTCRQFGEVEAVVPFLGEVERSRIVRQHEDDFVVVLHSVVIIMLRF